MELHFIDIYIKYNGQNIATVVLLFMSGAIWWQIPCTSFFLGSHFCATLVFAPIQRPMSFYI